MRTDRIPPPESLQWLSKQHPGTLAASILGECIKIQQLRQQYFPKISRSSDNFVGGIPWWRGVLEAAEKIDTRLAQLVSQFDGRWDIYRTPGTTQSGEPTALD